MAIDTCPTPTPPQRGVVRFDATEFRAIYPQFAAVTPELLGVYFTQATFYINNSCGSRVCDAVQRQHLLYLLTAHIAQLFSGVNGEGPSGGVGRVTSAQQGSVSASFEFPASPDGAWYSQTPFGAMYWAATAQFRSFIYVAAPPTCGDLYGGFRDPYGYPGSDPGCGC